MSRPIIQLIIIAVLTNVYRFDSSVGRGDFQTRIGVGQVIKGMSQLHCDARNVEPGTDTGPLRLGRGHPQHRRRHDAGRKVHLDHLQRLRLRQPRLSWTHSRERELGLVSLTVAHILNGCSLTSNSDVELKNIKH